MILIIDNYDSFTYNLYQLVGKYTNDITVARNDKVTLDDVKKIDASHIILSPGPGHPKNNRDFGICTDIINNMKSTPILGVCLGHQGIYYNSGGKIINNIPVHGKKDIIHHEDSEIFRDIPQEFEAVRYHSLICDKKKIPENIKVTSYTQDGIIMSIEDRHYPTYGIQFHPESIGSTYGDKIIENFLKI